MYPDGVAVWHLDDDGDVIEPCETDSDLDESYTNWKQ